ncbi:ATP synthase F1 subunit delta [Novipirellula artificiosorum]|uniref:ATP synthase subunit delta n=1 Tax=Novipirellula artificiosorum TaxID=2528016 RepID=A0A5C6D2J2_9BACT|nr:ATP synthase F1 subunit delta [Novipirellula artificiosorum]TWU30958.1 ATP synthase subunit delta [Novipirellula artificiosorum]
MSEAPKHDTVLDTGAEQLGRTYARALMGAAQNEGVADQVVEQLGRVVDDYLSQSEPLATTFASPRVKQEEKIRVIDRLFADDFHPVLVKFLKVMAHRERLGYVAAVRIAAETLLDESVGQVVASVRTATALNEALRGQVTERLSAVLGRAVRLEETVDPDLVGGMVIRVGDTVFDGSVANRLDQMGRKAREGFSSQLMKRFESFLNDNT